MSKHDHQRVALSKLVISREHKKVKFLNKFANGIKEHVTGNLSLRAKLLIGGMDNVFKKIFNNVKEGERLLKASHCCLYTTEGSITGLLFISTDKLAFCSDRSVVKLFSQTGESLRFRYKVVIPLRKIDRAVQSENSSKKSKKYLQLITKDEFEFWFKGFINCTKVCKCIHQAISPVHS
ncbi:GEM-like protein 4 [Amaranthus tricolor]|uniref:GEM-like protein 4 n=1 Tax=Amaranthus tricolor TaxID=29722 RepID=UPI00258496C7|nr:GEM-like protein 4 [Amaranthus tricolor]